MTKTPKSSGSGDDRRYPTSDVKLLYGLSGGLCAFPGCRKRCIQFGVDVIKKVMVGQIGHIEGVGKQGPRHNPLLTGKQRDCYNNWILLCNIHHPVLDEMDGDKRSKYSVETLRKWKADIEGYVTRRLQKTMPIVSSVELDVVTKFVLGVAADPNADFTLVDPARKVKKNGLTSAVEEQLKIGLGKSNEVEKYVTHVSIINPEFPDALRAGFVSKYTELWDDDLRGDSIFFELRDFACKYSEDTLQEAAALAILAYLFERCEVFEK